MQAGDIITIGISQADINYGIARNCELCPVARAFQRRGLNYAIGPIWFCKNDGEDNPAYRFRTPKALADFITRFDCGYPVKPLTVRFKLVQY